MKIYEFEAKDILSTYEVPTPRGELAVTGQQARDVATKLRVPVALKAQVLIAGRGKAGGILFADNPGEVEEAAEKLLGAKIDGVTVTKLLVEEKLSIKRELYFGITVDRPNRCYVAVASEVGGEEIELAAEMQPQRISRQLINPKLGFRRFHAMGLAKIMGYSGAKMQELAEILQKLFAVCIDCDAELAEMNPLIETLDGKFVAADARLIIDDNALFRHLDFARKRLSEPRELDSQEFEALKCGIDYVKLGGNIGVMGNGAGLVMATLDMINLCGGKPANFLDIGGGAHLERIDAALKIVSSDPKVKVVFVNIMGGITLCNEVAQGIILARQQLRFSKPIVIRLVGTNEEEGKRLLRKANLPFFDSMEDAAVKAVEIASEAS